MVKRRRRRFSSSLITWVAVGVVVAIVLTIVLIKSFSSSGPQTDSFGQTPVPVFNAVTTVPASVFNTIKVESPDIAVQAPFQLKGQPSFTVDGLPGSFYFGAEYCPYCAATRWGMIIALSRFGTFDKLYNMFSSSTDYAPNTPTFTLYQVGYKSKYLAFTGYEVEDRNKKPLMTLPDNVAALVGKYNQNQNFPFMDIDNKVFIEESAFDPNVLQGITTQAAIADALTNTSNPVTQAIITTANYVSAGICATAKDPPASVCDSAGVKAAASALKLKL